MFQDHLKKQQQILLQVLFVVKKNIAMRVVFPFFWKHKRAREREVVKKMLPLRIRMLHIFMFEWRHLI